MSEPPIDPLDEELAALLRVEREARVERGALDRVWSKLARSLPGGGSGPGSGGYLGAKAFLVLGGTVLGGALILASSRHTSSPRPTERYVHARVEAPTTASSAAAYAADLAAAAPPRPTVDSRPAAIARFRNKAVDLDRERALLDDARSDLRNRDGAAALAAVERHVRDFEHPALAEEREALAVQALVMSGRYDDARTRATRFRAAWPNSLFTSTIDASLASIP